MGLLSTLKSIFGGGESQGAKKGTESAKAPAGPEKKPQTDMKEVSSVSNKITAGHVHMSGCTGCLVAVADNYGGLLTLLDKYVDWVYDLTLADVRHIPKMDVALVEGSVCINDKLSVQEIKETREKAAIVVAVGGCACYGNITRFSRGGQQNQPAHEAFLPIGDLINVDVYIPGCAPTPQLIRNVCVMAYLLLKGNDEQKKLAEAYLKPLMTIPKQGTEACFCDLMTKVIDQGLCMGCGSCASACPVRAITHEYGKPQGQRDLCIKCGACYNQCPRSWFSFDVVSNYETILGAIRGALQ
jgi:coenzyme F420 hydrogenase subunit gamma